MKVAIVHDELVRRGGAEQVAICLHKLFPDAPIFTLAYNANSTYPYFKDKDVRQSWFGRFVKGERNLKRFFFPFGMLAMPTLNLKGYDLIIISSTYCGKYIKPDKNAIVINYCHNPFRLAWQPEEYREYTQSKGLKKLVFNWVINALRSYDKSFANRTNYYITNAQIVKERIIKSYQPSVPIEVINPPVNCDRFSVSNKLGDYFLVVCRLEFYKKVDIAIEAFNDLGLPLLIVGKGSKEEELKAMAKPNVIFRKNISNEDLANIYENCKALIFPQFEDYGITPLEATACGRPVIAYGKGGILETMVPYLNENTNWTSVFFEEQTKESLKGAINLFLTLNPNHPFIRSHAEKFDEKGFMSKIKAQIEKWHVGHNL
jgi:glycosyltransferase involved in cell wall biosynthesis